ncbi:SIR2 family protein [Marinobacter pelagius]|uniref:SIR2 family protein n=1 Tax=Marinobacter sp. C7 TaxID=2951363 RepID=UPI001EF0483D|nr:SIR2 family protein [Marinobacter sp. C7]MCG7199633.1 SIR2 family protein [Marinobacter sp. C7]
MSDFEKAIEFAQECVSKTPVVLLGSGASAAHGIPGMWPLGAHIKENPPKGMSSEDAQGWNQFSESLDQLDLESALTKTRLPEHLTDHIVHSTRSFLFPHDHDVFLRAISERESLPLSRLYHFLFQSTHQTIHVVTPNYDRIAEYASDLAGYSYFTGFEYGYINRRARDENMRVHQAGRPVRTVCIWKVHGSFDWFKDRDNQVFFFPNCWETPEGYTPVMITPGVDKFRRGYQEPFRTIIGAADSAIDAARSYLCIGFGFNDEHLQTKLVERCQGNDTPIVIITKELTDTAKNFLFKGRCRQFLAMEEYRGGTMIYTHFTPDGVHVPEQSLWQLDKFLDVTIGD